MARTLQKKIVLSKGQIAPELIERTDLELYDKSAQLMQNWVPTIYGGARTRRGTNWIADIEGATTSTEITSYVGGVEAYLETADQYYVTDNIGTARNVFMIDYGEELNPADVGYLVVKGIGMTSASWKVASYTTKGNYSFNLAADRQMEIRVHGGGGGSSSHDGGAGGYLHFRVMCAAGTYTIKVGGGGAGATAYSRNHPGANGEASSITCTNFSVNCPGGGKGINYRAHYDERNSTYTYAPTYSFSTYSPKIFLKSTTYRPRRASWLEDKTTYGQGGKSVSKKAAGNPGTVGMVDLAFTTINIIIETSTDGETWTTIKSGYITQTAQDLIITPSANFRYVRLRLNESNSYNFTGKIRIRYAKLSNYGGKNNGVVDGIKMIDYAYNNSDRMVMLLMNGLIYVYKNDALAQTVAASGLSKDRLPDLKYTSKDDTIIFTHPEMSPKIMKRSGSTWTFGDLSISNIPYTLFGNETSATKTVKIKPSGVEGSVSIVADSAIFDSDYVGQIIDGNGGRLRVTEYTDSTHVAGNTIIPFYTDEKIDEWKYISGYEKVWSNTRGWPATCLFAQQRLWFGGSKGKPTSVWASRLGDYFNFKNAGNYDNDSISIDLLTNGPIVNMVENRGIHIFTTDEEISIPETSYTPDKIQATVNTQNGSVKELRPVVVGGVVIFCEKNGKSLLSYVYNDEQASYVTNNISLLSNLMSDPVAMAAEINSAKDKGNFLYVVLADGTMLVECLSLDQNINAVCKYSTDGDIIDVCCLRDDSYILVNRDNVLSLEKIADVHTDRTLSTRLEGNALTLPDFYRGKRVWFYGDDFAEVHTVETDGSVELDREYFGDVNYGLPIYYDLEGNPISINGKTYGIKKRITMATIVCEKTKYLHLNGQVKEGEDVYRFYGCTPYDYDVRYNIAGEFWPVNIVSMEFSINYEG